MSIMESTQKELSQVTNSDPQIYLVQKQSGKQLPIKSCNFDADVYSSKLSRVVIIQRYENHSRDRPIDSVFNYPTDIEYSLQKIEMELWNMDDIKVEMKMIETVIEGKEAAQGLYEETLQREAKEIPENAEGEPVKRGMQPIKVNMGLIPPRTIVMLRCYMVGTLQKDNGVSYFKLSQQLFPIINTDPPPVEEAPKNLNVPQQAYQQNYSSESGSVQSKDFRDLQWEAKTSKLDPKQLKKQQQMIAKQEKKALIQQKKIQEEAMRKQKKAEQDAVKYQKKLDRELQKKEKKIKKGTKKNQDQDGAQPDQQALLENDSRSQSQSQQQSEATSPLHSNMDATEDAEGTPQINQDKIKLEEQEEEQLEISPTYSEQSGPKLLDIKIRIHESYNNYFNYQFNQVNKIESLNHKVKISKEKGEELEYLNEKISLVELNQEAGTKKWKSDFLILIEDSIFNIPSCVMANVYYDEQGNHISQNYTALMLNYIPDIVQTEDEYAKQRELYSQQLAQMQAQQINSPKEIASPIEPEKKKKGLFGKKKQKSEKKIEVVKPTILTTSKLIEQAIIPDGTLKPQDFIFMVDRSEIMYSNGDQSYIRKVKEALKVIIQSLPYGSKFNIIGYGATVEQFSEQQSLCLNEENIESAMADIETYDNFERCLGGYVNTDIYSNEQSPEVQQYAPIDYQIFDHLTPGLNRTVFIISCKGINRAEDVIDMYQRQSAYTDVRIHSFIMSSLGQTEAPLLEKLATASFGTTQFIKKDNLIESIFSSMDQGYINWRKIEQINIYNKQDVHVFDLATHRGFQKWFQSNRYIRNGEEFSLQMLDCDGMGYLQVEDIGRVEFAIYNPNQRDCEYVAVSFLDVTSDYQFAKVLGVSCAVDFIKKAEVDNAICVSKQLAILCNHTTLIARQKITEKKLIKAIKKKEQEKPVIPQAQVVPQIQQQEYQEQSYQTDQYQDQQYQDYQNNQGYDNQQYDNQQYSNQQYEDSTYQTQQYQDQSYQNNNGYQQQQYEQVEYVQPQANYDDGDELMYNEDSTPMGNETGNFIQVTVEDLYGKIIFIDCYDSETVFAFKFKLQNQEGVPIDDQRLFLKDQELEGFYQLRDYVINSQTSINLFGTLTKSKSWNKSSLGKRQFPTVQKAGIQQKIENTQNQQVNQQPSLNKYQSIQTQNTQQNNYFEADENELAFQQTGYDEQNYQGYYDQGNDGYYQDQSQAYGQTNQYDQQQTYEQPQKQSYGQQYNQQQQQQTYQEPQTQDYQMQVQPVVEKEETFEKTETYFKYYQPSNGSEKPKFIKIKQLGGKTLHLQIYPSQTGLEIKQKIQEMEGHNPKQIKLVRAGKVMENDHKCVEHQIDEGATLTMVIKMSSDLGKEQQEDAAIDKTFKLLNGAKAAVDVEKFIFNIQTADSQYLQISVSEKDKIKEVKNQIKALTQTPKKEQILYFQGHILESSSTIDECDIREDEVVHCFTKDDQIVGGKACDFYFFAEFNDDNMAESCPFMVPCKKTDRIEDILLFIQDKTGIEHQKLQLKSGTKDVDQETKILTDRSKKISDLEIPKGSTLEITIQQQNTKQMIWVKIFYCSENYSNENSIDCDPMMTVWQLKTKIKEIFWYKHHQQRLTYQGDLMDEYRSLKFYNIYDGSQIILTDPAQNLIHIRMPQGNIKTLKFDPSQYVQELKYALENIEGGLPPYFQRLSLGVNELEDCKTIEEYNIHRDDMINLAIIPPISVPTPIEIIFRSWDSQWELLTLTCQPTDLLLTIKKKLIWMLDVNVFGSDAQRLKMTDHEGREYFDKQSVQDCEFKNQDSIYIQRVWLGEGGTEMISISNKLNGMMYLRFDTDSSATVNQFKKDIGQRIGHDSFRLYIAKTGESVDFNKVGSQKLVDYMAMGKDKQKGGPENTFEILNFNYQQIVELIQVTGEFNDKVYLFCESSKKQDKKFKKFEQNEINTIVGLKLLSEHFPSDEPKWKYAAQRSQQWLKNQLLLPTVDDTMKIVPMYKINIK